MLQLLSQSKHEEFESNSELQVRNQKKGEAETRRIEEAESKAAKFLQPAKFRRLRNCLLCHCSPFTALFTFLRLFTLFDSFVTFWFASYFTLYVIVIVHVIW